MLLLEAESVLKSLSSRFRVLWKVRTYSVNRMEHTRQRKRERRKSWKIYHNWTSRTLNQENPKRSYPSSFKMQLFTSVSFSSSSDLILHSTCSPPFVLDVKRASDFRATSHLTYSRPTRDYDFWDYNFILHIQ